jgi:lysophospholipase L1-like esterase
MNHPRRALLILLVLVLHVGCGKEPATEGSTTEEPTTAPAATSSNLDYVAFGDSLATGYGITDSYVYRYANLMGTDIGTPVNVRNLGVNGLTSQQLRAEIENDQRAKDAVEQAEVITINIGANDLMRARLEYRTGNCGGADNQDCLRQAVDEFRANWDAILADITDTRSPGTTIIRTIDFYNPFVEVDRARYSGDASVDDFVIFKKYLEQVNSHIAKSSDAYDIPHTEVYETFNGPNGDGDPSRKGYIASDGVHPTEDGHAAIAQELRKLAYEPL